MLLLAFFGRRRRRRRERRRRRGDARSTFCLSAIFSPIVFFLSSSSTPSHSQPTGRASPRSPVSPRSTSAPLPGVDKRRKSGVLACEAGSRRTESSRFFFFFLRRDPDELLVFLALSLSLSSLFNPDLCRSSSFSWLLVFFPSPRILWPVPACSLSSLPPPIDPKI